MLPRSDAPHWCIFPYGNLHIFIPLSHWRIVPTTYSRMGSTNAVIAHHNFSIINGQPPILEEHWAPYSVSLTTKLKKYVLIISIVLYFRAASWARSSVWPWCSSSAPGSTLPGLMVSTSFRRKPPPWPVVWHSPMRRCLRRRPSWLPRPVKA